MAWALNSGLYRFRGCEVFMAGFSYIAVQKSSSPQIGSEVKCTEFLGVEILLFCCCWFIRFLVLGKGGFVAAFAVFPNRPRGGGWGNHLLELHRAAVVQ